MRVSRHLYASITHKYLFLHYRRTVGIVVMGWCFGVEIRRRAENYEAVVDACFTPFVRID
jgi:hypothetical protein